MAFQTYPKMVRDLGFNILCHQAWVVLLAGQEAGAKNLPGVFRQNELLAKGNILEKDAGDESTSG